MTNKAKTSMSRILECHDGPTFEFKDALNFLRQKMKLFQTFNYLFAFFNDWFNIHNI